MKASSSKKPSKPASRRFIKLRQAKGRIVKEIELTGEPDNHGIVIRFQDNTDLEVLIDPVLEFKTRFYDGKGGSQRVTKRWPTVRSHVG